VAIGKKSYCGSFSTSKPALKLKFSSNENEIENLIGMQYITLNNCIQDPSYIRQPLGYLLFKQAGLPYSRCNFARVYVNDTDYGVYLNIEPIKKRHTQNNFNGNDNGNLYEIEEEEDFTQSIIATDRISFEGFSKYSDKQDLELAVMEISDNGPGIEDIELAMTEGFSTATDEDREMGFGAGMGLPNMRKNADEFRIDSQVGVGTKVFMLFNTKTEPEATH
jgi:hypothetical protein